MLQIYDEEYGQLELWMEFYPRDPFQLPEELKLMAQILDRIEVLQPFIDQYRKAAEETGLALTGRKTVPLRCFVGIMYLYKNYSLGYRGTMERIADSFNWRAFCRIPLSKEVPDYSTISKLANRYGAKAVDEMNQALLQHLKAEKILKTKQVRMDTTVVESNIAYPTDAGILSQGIKTINRLVSKVKEAGVQAAEDFTAHERVVKKKLLAIAKIAKRRTREAISEINKITKELTTIAQNTLAMAKRTLQGAKISFAKGKQTLNRKLIEQLDETCGLLQKAIEQAKTVVSGNRHIENRLVSIYEPEARPICKGKSGQPVQFGRKLLLTGNEQGFITSHKLYQGNPNDKTLFKEGIEGHNRNAGKKAREASTDRGFYASSNETYAESEKIRLSMPKIGKKSQERIAYEKQPWFKRLQRSRAGMEAIISIANRRSGLCRPLTRGTPKVECSVGWSVFAYNLAIVPQVKLR